VLAEQAAGERIAVLAPLVRGRKGEYQKELEQARRGGFLRARIDGRLVELEPGLRLAKQRRHTVEIVVDRLTAGRAAAPRLADSLETALRLAGGLAAAVRESRLTAPPAAGKGGGRGAVAPGEDWLFSERAACPECGVAFDELAPRLFSFNSPYGACPACSGLGTHLEIDPELVVPDPDLSLAAGRWSRGARPWPPGTPASCGRWPRTSR